MSERFAVGEIAIVALSKFGRSACECEIIAGLHMAVCGRTGDEIAAYSIRCAEGDFYAEPWQLRKKPQPRESAQLGRWNECPWQPEKVSA